MQKINFIPPFFLEALQRYCKLVILGTLGMSGYGCQKRWYHFVENFDSYLHANNQIHPHLCVELLLRYCKLVILGTLDMPGHAHQRK